MWLDYTGPIDPGALITNGVEGVFRYLSWPHYWGGATHTGVNPKIIQRGEYERLIKAGIKVILNWEYDARDWMSGANGGKAHGIQAVVMAKDLGYPAGSPLPGSADFNMSRSDWTSVGKAYGKAYATEVIKGGYVPGVYGPWDVLDWVSNELPEFGFFWQAGMSWAWSNNRNKNDHPKAHMIQRKQIMFAGYSVDVNEEMHDWETGMPTAQEFWEHPIGPQGNQRPAHFFLTDAANQVDAGKSSYDGRIGFLPAALADVQAGVNALQVELDALKALLTGLSAGAGTFGVTGELRMEKSTDH